MSATAQDHVPHYAADWPPIPKDGLPPGPAWPALVQSLAFMRFRHAFVPWLHRKYGDVFTIRLIPGGRQIVMFSRPEHIKEIFAGDPEVFYAGKANAILGAMMGEHSLLLVDSAQHKRARKLLMPAFSPKPLKDYEGLVTELARAELDTWHTGTSFRSLERMNALTLEVIMRVVFGVTDEKRAAELRPLLRTVVNVSPAVLIGISYPWLMRIGMWKTFVTNREALDKVLYAEIADRRRATDLASRTDVLSQLLHVGDSEGEEPLNDAELRDQLVTLLLAGHETTATALAWTLQELGRSPEQLARAQRAADEGDDAYLEAVLKESMRLHPVIPMVVRLLMKPATVGGIEIPAGASVAPSIILSHQENFTDADEFKPTRFLDEKVAPNTWIPFGGGVRRCIGAGFSLMEGVAVLRELLARYDVQAEGDEVPLVRNITSVPKKGASIVVRARG
ncbi:MAG TPA: cytochrome P450 [Nocardioidaceae bacterium]|nr:cytochrome P450 [Nocardioidaceae bacterium]